jgi:ABC-type sulfate transport system permease component
MMNQRQNMFQLYVIQLKVYNMVIYYLIFISSLQTRINKALSPLCSCQTEGMEQRQLFIKGRSCFCCMASNMRCVRAFLYRAFKAQRIDMFAAKMRDSVLTLPLLHTASCAMQKNIAGFEALKQLENPNVWFQVKVTVTQPVYVTCVANPSSSPTTWWISDITCLGFIWIQKIFLQNF